MNLYDGGVIVLYASWRMGNALDAKLGVFIVSLAFYSVWFDLMVVEFRFCFPATTLLCFTRLDCFTFFFYTLLSPHSLPCHGKVGMAICCGFSWEGTLEKILGWWNKKHKREWEIHKKLRFVTCSFSSFFFKQERS